MSKTRINYKSDFSLDVTFAINRAPVSLPVNDFLVRFFVDGAPGTDYVCGYKGGEYISCEKKDDDTLTCYIDNHKFGCGRLCCEFIDLEDNEKFTDKIQKTVTPSRLDVVLVEGPGDASTSVSASVMVDIEAVISDLRDALDNITDMRDDIETLKDDVNTLSNAVEGKLDYYDASWIYRASQRTVENFNALKEASLAHKVVVASGDVCYSDAESVEDLIILVICVHGGFNRIIISLDEGVVSVEIAYIVYASADAVGALDTRVTTAEESVTNMQTELAKLPLKNNTTNRGANKVGYFNALIGGKTVAEAIDWLISDTKRYHAAMWLENDKKVFHWNSMSNAIDEDRLIMRGSVPAIDASKSGDDITVSFPTATGIDTYVATKGDGEDVTVVKTTKTFLFTSSPSQQL